MASRKPDFRFCSAVGSQLVRDDHVGCVALFLQKLAHEFDGCDLVAPSLHEQVQYLALAVDGSPEPEALATDYHHHFVQMPLTGCAGTALAKFPGEQHPELEHPSPDRLV